MLKISGKKAANQLQHEISLSIEFIGKIRDSLHKTVCFTKYEKVIIDRPEFQRLRRIRQTGFIDYIFPGATHSRFEHSLGAMHIAHLMINSIIQNQHYMLISLEEIRNEKISKSQKAKNNNDHLAALQNTHKALDFLKKSPYILQCIRFAALLHDCGHGPLSHSSEKFMASWKQLQEQLPLLDIPKWLKLALQKKQNLQETITHEFYTLLIIAKMFRSKKELFLSEAMAQDICAILDLSIEPSEGNDLSLSGLQSLLHDIISGEVDADRMDYLLRDSMKSGVMYGYFDLERILDSLGFYCDVQTQKFHLSIKKSGVFAFEDYLRARLSMYQQVYFHKTATACEAMLEYLKEKSSAQLPIEIDQYLKIDDMNFPRFLLKKSNSYNKKEFQKTVKNLFFERRLWKKSYEDDLNVKDISNRLEVEKKLNEQKIPFKCITSKANITKFDPTNVKSKSKNTFRVILKDDYSLFRLEPIEKHSKLLSQLFENISIQRIFSQNKNK